MRVHGLKETRADVLWRLRAGSPIALDLLLRPGCRTFACIACHQRGATAHLQQRPTVARRGVGEMALLDIGCEAALALRTGLDDVLQVLLD